MPTARSLVLASVLCLGPTVGIAHAGPAEPSPVIAPEPAPAPVPAPMPPPSPGVTVIETGPGAGGWVEPEPVTLATRPNARHAIYVEATTLILTNSIGISYAYRPIRGLAVSAGFGAGAATGLFVSAHGYGGQLMLHGLFGGASSSSFEIAAGASLIRADGSIIFLEEESDDTPPTLRVFPSGFLGYRYQPLDGGLLARAGAAWSFGFGIGFSGSIGFTF